MVLKGQITIIAIVMLLVALLVLAVLAPLFMTAVDLILNATVGDATSQLLVRLVFPILLIALIISILGYAAIARQGYEGFR